MTRVLLAAHASVGHTNGLRSIGRALLATGDAVAMVVPQLRAPPLATLPENARAAAAIPEQTRADGIEVHTVATPLAALWHGAKLSRATGYRELWHALAMFTTGLPAHARSIAAFATSWRADVVVADYLFFAAWYGVRLARPLPSSSRLPFVSFYHSALPFPAAGAPPTGSDLPNGTSPDSDEWRAAQRELAALSTRTDARLAAAARALRIAPPAPGVLSRPYSGELNIITSLPELEPGLLPLDPAPVLFAGACVFGRAQNDLDDPALQVLRAVDANMRRRIYVSMGTVFNDNPVVFETILKGVDDGVRVVVVSAGASAAHLQRRRAAPAQPGDARIHIFARVPQLAVLASVDVVVTHGGNNTVQETLAAGRPMLVVPFGGDQLQNARRVERLGVGIALLPAELTSDAVRAAIARLIDDPSFAARAAACAAVCHGVDGTARAVDAIRALVRRPT